MTWLHVIPLDGTLLSCPKCCSFGVVCDVLRMSASGLNPSHAPSTPPLLSFRLHSSRYLFDCLPACLCLCYYPYRLVCWSIFPLSVSASCMATCSSICVLRPFPLVADVHRRAYWCLSTPRARGPPTQAIPPDLRVRRKALAGQQGHQGEHERSKSGQPQFQSFFKQASRTKTRYRSLVSRPFLAPLATRDHP